ncbi:hypothetical protein [Piscinibacter terrae]|uniref:Uncharacterized protein n=1 Tax=Piscinibacter terrae TaxID=2496871 RepID=A0A3N7HLL3_9BURK|nr:hypothetical protein [Albitalea terrae]RQP22984.1 hypothetical protein DZC73_17795 [Albitalea terrae]
MATPPIPVKTAEGQSELTSRQRRLTQRQRTVLLLVDGRRSEAEVRSMAVKAGATESCFGELMDMGLIAVPAVSALPGQPPAAPVPPAQPNPDHMATIPIPRPEPAPEDDSVHVDIPLEPPKPADKKASALPEQIHLHDETESILPAARTLHPESIMTDSVLSQQRIPDSDFDDFEAARSGDSSLEEARGILMRAVKAEAPLTGSLTMMRLRRARTRTELAELIDEVESRIIKPYRSLAAQQVLRRARYLLDARTNPLAAS